MNNKKCECDAGFWGRTASQLQDKLNKERTENSKFRSRLAAVKAAISELDVKERSTTTPSIKNATIQNDEKWYENAYQSLQADYAKLTRELEDCKTLRVEYTTIMNKYESSLRQIDTMFDRNVALRQESVDKDSKIGALELGLRDIREVAQTRYSETLVSAYKKIKEIVDRSLETYASLGKVKDAYQNLKDYHVEKMSKKT